MATYFVPLPVSPVVGPIAPLVTAALQVTPTADTPAIAIAIPAASPAAAFEPLELKALTLVFDSNNCFTVTNDVPQANSSRIAALVAGIAASASAFVWSAATSPLIILLASIGAAWAAVMIYIVMSFIALFVGVWAIVRVIRWWGGRDAPPTRGVDQIDESDMGDSKTNSSTSSIDLFHDQLAWVAGEIPACLKQILYYSPATTQAMIEHMALTSADNVLEVGRGA